MTKEEFVDRIREAFESGFWFGRTTGDNVSTAWDRSDQEFYAWLVNLPEKATK